MSGVWFTSETLRGFSDEDIDEMNNALKMQLARSNIDLHFVDQGDMEKIQGFKEKILDKLSYR